MQNSQRKIVLKAQRISDRQKMDLERLSKYSQEQLSKAAADGGWSLIQVLNHLYVSQKGTVNFLEKQLSEPQKLTSTIKLKEKFYAFLLSRFLKSKKKIKAPKSLPDPFSDTDFKELKEKFEGLMVKTHAIAESIPPNLENKKIFKHPRAGWLNIFDVLNFLHDHWYHHEYQMANLEKELQNG